MKRKTERRVDSGIWYYLPLVFQRKIVIVYILQAFTFFSIIVFFFWICRHFIYGALLVQTVLSFGGTYPYRYITKNAQKIRYEYRSKYGSYACQKLWLNYQSYTIPILSSSLYLPILVHNNSFLPSIIKLENSFIVHKFIPSKFEVILIMGGSFLIITGGLIRRYSGGFSPFIESYFHVIYPEKGKLIKEGAYKYVRHPRYLGRGMIAMGLALVANNLLAILLALIHFLAFCALIPLEEKELVMRFGKEYKNYKKKTPVILPRYGDWKNFIKWSFSNILLFSKSKRSKKPKKPI